MYSLYGNDWAYADSRLRGSVVRLGAEPIEILEVNEDCIVKGTTLQSPAVRKAVVCPLADLNLKPVSLGYVNYSGRASYIVRKPKRNDWRQGMRYDNITSIQGYSSNEIPMNYIRLTILNQFPSFEKCLTRLKKNSDTKSVAWHRHWALDKSLEVFYKGSRVGSYNSGIVLDSGYKHLEEYLKEVLC